MEHKRNLKQNKLAKLEKSVVTSVETRWAPNYVATWLLVSLP